MSRGVTIVAVGFLITAVSLGWWLLSRPSEQAGDAAAVEHTLTSTTDLPVQNIPSPPSPAVHGADPVAPESSVPQFTIGQQSRRRERIPTALRVPAIDVSAPVIGTGVEPNGDMEVPDNVTDVGWYKYGPAPGEPGSAVLAAHVDLASQGSGVFFDLRSLEPGDIIHVDFDDGTTETYRTAARTIYEKTELPTDAIFAREGLPVLTLITCGGGFNRSAQSYDSNVVVYAMPFDPDFTIDQESSPRAASKRG